MEIPTHQCRCPLGKYQVSQPDPDEIKRDVWRRQGVLVVSPSDGRLNWLEQGQLRRIAEKLYGQRGNRG